jgi:hypothetical protein
MPRQLTRARWKHHRSVEIWAGAAIAINGSLIDQDNIFSFLNDLRDIDLQPGLLS